MKPDNILGTNGAAGRVFDAFFQQYDDSRRKCAPLSPVSSASYDIETVTNDGCGGWSLSEITGPSYFIPRTVVSKKVTLWVKPFLREPTQKEYTVEAGSMFYGGFYQYTLTLRDALGSVLAETYSGMTRSCFKGWEEQKNELELLKAAAEMAIGRNVSVCSCGWLCDEVE
jgi:hypothetical protein